MRKLTLLVLGTALAVWSQSGTTVYLHDTSSGFKIISPGCTNTTPMVCSLDNITGLSTSSPNNVVSIAGVCSTNPGAYNISPANGLRKISAITPGSGTTGTIALTDLGGTSIAGNGAWCDGSYQAPNYLYQGGEQYGSLVHSYQTVSGIKGFFDGDNGSLMQQWALGTANGLTSLVVATNVATVTTGYAHGVSAGDHISIFGTTSSSLNRNGITYDGSHTYGTNDYTVLASPAPTTCSTSGTFERRGLTSRPRLGLRMPISSFPSSTPSANTGTRIGRARLSRSMTSRHRWSKRLLG